jgi:hypothetical protein
MLPFAVDVLSFTRGELPEGRVWLKCEMFQYFMGRNQEHVPLAAYGADVAEAVEAAVRLLEDPTGQEVSDTVTSILRGLYVDQNLVDPDDVAVVGG